MVIIPKILLVTTSADFSLPLFFAEESTRLIRPTSIDYNSPDKKLDEIFRDDFDYVYFRDPFNDKAIPDKLIRKNTDRILRRYQLAYKVDGITSYEDMLFEDKWRQYRAFSNFMPHTELLSSLDIPNLGSKFIKERISCRARGVIFSKSDFPDKADPSNYVVQPRLDIEVEYRVYMIGGEIIKPLAIKSSKTAQDKVRLTGVKETVPAAIVDIARATYDVTRYDLMGLDIAKTASRYYLLEVNRSSQFKGYLRHSRLNLATLLDNYLLTIERSKVG